MIHSQSKKLRACSIRRNLLLDIQQIKVKIWFLWVA
jgi:hypothetical protein